MSKTTGPKIEMKDINDEYKVKELMEAFPVIYNTTSLNQFATTCNYFVAEVAANKAKELGFNPYPINRWASYETILKPPTGGLTTDLFPVPKTTMVGKKKIVDKNIIEMKQVKFKKITTFSISFKNSLAFILTSMVREATYATSGCNPVIDMDDEKALADRIMEKSIDLPYNISPTIFHTNKRYTNLFIGKYVSDSYNAESHVIDKIKGYIPVTRLQQFVANQFIKYIKLLCIRLTNMLWLGSKITFKNGEYIYEGVPKTTDMKNVIVHLTNDSDSSDIGEMSIKSTFNIAMRDFDAYQKIFDRKAKEERKEQKERKAEEKAKDLAEKARREEVQSAENGEIPTQLDSDIAESKGISTTRRKAKERNGEPPKETKDKKKGKTDAKKTSVKRGRAKKAEPTDDDSDAESNSDGE